MKSFKNFVENCGYEEMINLDLQSKFINQLDQETEYSEDDMYQELDSFLEGKV